MTFIAVTVGTRRDDKRHPEPLIREALSLSVTNVGVMEEFSGAAPILDRLWISPIDKTTDPDIAKLVIAREQEFLGI